MPKTAGAIGFIACSPDVFADEVGLVPLLVLLPDLTALMPAARRTDEELELLALPGIPWPRTTFGIPPPRVTRVMRADAACVTWLQVALPSPSWLPALPRWLFPPPLPLLCSRLNLFLLSAARFNSADEG